MEQRKDTIRTTRHLLSAANTLFAEKGFRDSTNEKLLEHQLAILTGKAPGIFGPPAAAGSAGLPPMPVTGLPVQLIQRRPDIRPKSVTYTATWTFCASSPQS